MMNWLNSAQYSGISRKQTFYNATQIAACLVPPRYFHNLHEDKPDHWICDLTCRSRLLRSGCTHPTCVFDWHLWFHPQIDAERSPDEVFTQICQVMETFWFGQIGVVKEIVQIRSWSWHLHQTAARWAQMACMPPTLPSSLPKTSFGQSTWPSHSASLIFLYTG